MPPRDVTEALLPALPSAGERTILLERSRSTADPVATSRAGSTYGRRVKPLVDRLGAALLGLLLLPVILAIALVVLLALGRPVLYRQRRVGRHGQVFEILKFRTMRPEDGATAATSGRRPHKCDDDPRHTPVGRLLRRASLDELPQLWNVLTGTMSLVGPRPELEELVADYAAWQHQRHQVKPGITGLWQVTERAFSGGDMHHFTRTDLRYLEQLSFTADLRILLRTPIALLTGR